MILDTYLGFILVIITIIVNVTTVNY